MAQHQNRNQPRGRNGWAKWTRFLLLSSSVGGLLASGAMVLPPLPSRAQPIQPITQRLVPYQISQHRSSGAIAAKILDLKQSANRWIEIDLSQQRLFAWEGGFQVYAIKVSTGKTATPTPTGVFRVKERYQISRMQGADYDVPDVPYTMYFYGGYAIHGAYWHHRFGTPVSHGCVNVAVDHARWLYNWAAHGTPVVVHD
jgi:lipoprotein-anchoring transpeptidase ErfK/SrfK